MEQDSFLSFLKDRPDPRYFGGNITYSDFSACLYPLQKWDPKDLCCSVLGFQSGTVVPVPYLFAERTDKFDELRGAQESRDLDPLRVDTPSPIIIWWSKNNSDVCFYNFLNIHFYKQVMW